MARRRWRDGVEGRDRGEQRDGVLRGRPARHLGGDDPGGRVDVDHLAVNPQAQQHIPVREGQPELVAVHAAGHPVVVRAEGEGLARVRATGEAVPDPGRRHDLLTGQRDAVPRQHRRRTGPGRAASALTPPSNMPSPRASMPMFASCSAPSRDHSRSDISSRHGAPRPPPRRPSPGRRSRRSGTRTGRRAGPSAATSAGTSYIPSGTLSWRAGRPADRLLEHPHLGVRVEVGSRRRRCPERMSSRCRTVAPAYPLPTSAGTYAVTAASTSSIPSPQGPPPRSRPVTWTPTSAGAVSPAPCRRGRPRPARPRRAGRPSRRSTSWP